MGKRNINPISLKNLIPLNKRSPQERAEIARKGGVARLSRLEMLDNIYQLLEKEGVLEKIVTIINAEVENGILDHAIELLKLIKPSDKPMPSPLQIQKIFLSQQDIVETDVHIDAFIGEGEIEAPLPCPSPQKGEGSPADGVEGSIGAPLPCPSPQGGEGSPAEDDLL